jgi:hypothetical protein
MDGSCESVRSAMESQPIQTTQDVLGWTLKVQSLRQTRRGSVRVTDAEMAAINLSAHAFHGKWNYMIRPKPA